MGVKPLTLKQYTKFDLFKIIDEHTRECGECSKRNMEDMMKSLFCPKREIVSEELRDFRDKLFRGLSH